MPGLVLELKQDELIIINGAVIKFRAKSRIEINGKARFLFGKQVLLPHDSTTPARRIYLSLQTAYVGNEDERQSALAEAKTLIAAFRTQTISPATKEMLDRMVSFAEAGESYEALKLARSIIRFEDGLTAQPVVSAGTDRPTAGSAHPPPVQSL
jgi:flagellar protein FlbT